MKSIIILVALVVCVLCGSQAHSMSGAEIGQCMGDCASEQGICIANCQGDGQCIGNCASAHGRCVSRCH